MTRRTLERREGTGQDNPAGAARAMALAEKTFPILRGSSEVDEAPLMKPVKLQYQFAAEQPVKSVQVWLMLTSLLILVGAIAVIWRGQHLKRRWLFKSAS